MSSDSNANQLSKVSELFNAESEQRDPVKISISLDRSIRDRLKKEAGNRSFSEAVEKILKRALDRGVA